MSSRQWAIKTVGSKQWTVNSDSGQWAVTVTSGQWAVARTQWTVSIGLCMVGSGQWTDI